MATSARSRQSGSTAAISRSSTALPPYQPLGHPLNPAALHALHTLPQTHSLRSLKERIQTATNHLTEITGDLNDLHTSRAAAHARQAARKKADADWDGGEAERRLDDAWQQVESMTNQMEESTRHVIDAAAKVEGMEKALRDLDTDANAAAATQGSLGNSLPSRSQRSRRLGKTQLEEDEDDDEDFDDDEHTPALGPPPTETLKRKLQDWDRDYASLPLRDRYASHNAYIGFRKIVHDSRHPEDDPPPMPHASTWFSDAAASTASSQRRGADGDDNKSVPANQGGGGGGTQEAEEDEEEEVTIARERRTLRCPLTLLPLHDPLSSTRCPHAFEREAILSMLAAAARGRGGGGGGSSSMKCPECEAELSKETLVVDPVLVRKIRRIEERERREREEEEEEDDVDGGAGGGGGRGDVVTSSPVGEKGFGVLGRSPARIKREKMSGGVVRGEEEREREVSCVPATQIVDMEDP
ncbi:MAG: hypothetical protein LQ342_007247 [Letrouitia transgressa]|nr:MAG: hypothetical protein LQ342_007247 [Letrouitia transgressa]